MRIADANVRELAAELGEMRTDIDRLKAGGRATQLGKSTLEGEQVLVKNKDGDLMGVIGMVTTGTSDEVFIIAPMNPQPPAAPPAAVLTPFNEGIMVSHDGTAQPVDYQYHNVYGSSGTTFSTSTLFGRIYGNDTFPITPVPIGEPYNVWLTQVNTSDKESQPSAMATATPTAAVASEVLDGAITELKLADEAVTAAKVATSAITEVKIDSGAVTERTLATGAVTEQKINNNAITAAKLAANSVGPTKISDNAIETRHITANSIQAGQITAGAVTADKIAANSISADKIQANSIEAGHIAAGQIFAEHIGAGSITADHLTADSVTAATIRANSIQAQHITANSIQADKIAADQINANHIAAASILTEHLTALAITADKIAVNAINAGHISAGSITAAKLEANLVLVNRLIAGTPNGNRLEIHPTQGLQGFTNNGALRTLWFNATNGSLLATGKWQTKPSTDTTSERIEIDTDGTQTFIAPGNIIAGKIENIGAQGLMFRSGKVGPNAGYLFLNSNYVGINWGTQGGTIAASFGCDGAGIQSWGRLVGIRYQQHLAGDGTTPRLFILGTESDASDSGLSTLHFMKRGSPGNKEPIITATGQACGLLFEPGYVSATTGGAGLSYGPFRGSAFVVSSGEDTKDTITPTKFVGGRNELDVIEGAPSSDWYYKDDQPPAMSVANDGESPVLARVRNKSVDRAVWDEMPVEHPDKWVYEETPINIPYRRERHRFPMADDLAAIDPDIVNLDGSVDLRDMIGIMWGAQDKLIKHMRALHRVLKQHNIDPPPWPGKGDIAEGIGKRVGGRTRRKIDPLTGQAITG